MAIHTTCLQEEDFDPSSLIPMKKGLPKQEISVPFASTCVA